MAPAPTLCVQQAGFGVGGGKLSCLTLILLVAIGPAFGQSRFVAGTIPPAAVAVNSAGSVALPAKTVADGDGKKVGKGGIPQNLQPQVKRPPGTRTEPERKTAAAGKGLRSTESVRPYFLPLVAVPVSQPVRIDECRKQIQAAVQPARLIKLSEDCQRDFPATQFAEQIRGIAVSARRSLDIQRSIGLSGDFFEDSVGDAAYRDNLGKAVRGDKDAAYLLALAYRLGLSGVPASSRRMEQWLRFAAELGSGLACWELSEHYNYGGLVADAARFEKRAIELGYRPPFRLPTRGY